LPASAEPAAPAPPAEPPPSTDETQPPSWRLDDVLPPWLHVALVSRIRYEHLAENFRNGRPGSGDILNLRTSLHAELRPDIWRVGAELLDSRAYFTNDATAPNTGITNAMALLQAYGGVSAPVAPFHLDVKVGRMAMNVGSRRLVARNRFRNTINGFTGIDLQLKRDGWGKAQLFATLPIDRLPRERERLEDNAIEFDRERIEQIFAGQFIQTDPLPLGIIIEAYAFELFERDGERATRNRRLVTPGYRVVRPPAAGQFDFEFEGAIQVGTSRASANEDDLTDLDHLAIFQHGAVGYTIDTILEPRILAQYDYASGDGSPLDGSNNRFDTLFGARRFEFGPTGTYGALARSNLQSPGLRVQVKPHATVKGFVGWRAAWLAEGRDTWTTSGLRDPTGAAGTFIGHQLEGRVRYAPVPENLLLEVGAAHLFPGGFIDNAPDANPDSATTIAYVQLTGKI
ncbi:MAG: alginate export family protein, partial [Myxococcota bacterium]